MAIDVRNVSKSFNGFQALEDVSLSVPDGSLTALLGPSGGGKSTLLRVIAGLEAPDSGEVLFSGEAVTKLPAQERGVGFVFQHYAAFKHMTVRDNIAFGLKIRKGSRLSNWWLQVGSAPANTGDRRLPRRHLPSREP